MGLLRILGMNFDKKIDLKLGKTTKIIIPYYINIGGIKLNVSLNNKTLANEHLKEKYVKLSTHKGTFLVESIHNGKYIKGEMLILRRENISRGYKGKITTLKKTNETT